MIRGGEREGMDCPKYRPRKIELGIAYLAKQKERA
jgi:hypothetical protein